MQRHLLSSAAILKWVKKPQWRKAALKFRVSPQNKIKWNYIFFKKINLSWTTGYIETLSGKQVNLEDC